MARVSRSLVAGLLCASCVATVATPPPTLTHTTIAGATAAATGPYDDGFTAPTLNPKWHWINGQPPRWSLTARRGYMRIYTQTGKDMAGPLANATLLVQIAPTGNYEISTYVAFSPTQDYQQAGLIVFSNGTNFCKLVYVYNHLHNKGTNISMRHNQPPDYPSIFHAVPSSTGYFLQLDKVGANYTGFVSTDGMRWTSVQTYPGCTTVTPVYIGVFAVTGKGSTAPAIPADFDFFQERPLGAATHGPRPVARFAASA